MITPTTETLEPLLVCDDVQFKDLRQLAVQVCLKAFTDAKDRDPVKALDAVLWLTGPDIGWWCEWAGLSFVDPIALITSGRAITWKNKVLQKKDNRTIHRRPRSQRRQGAQTDE